MLAALAGLAASFEAVIGAWGYLGVFAVSLVSSASIIVPLPGPLLIAAAALVLNPWLVGIAAGLGSGIGELTGYAAGRAGKAVVQAQGAKQSASLRWLAWAEKWAQKRGMFFVVFACAATPLPMDIAGIVAGVAGYDWRRFLVASILGKTVEALAIALAAAAGAHWAVSALAL